VSAEFVKKHKRIGRTWAARRFDHKYARQPVIVAQ
jgi:hypothetical protein